METKYTLRGSANTLKLFAVFPSGQGVQQPTKWPQPITDPLLLGLCVAMQLWKQNILCAEVPTHLSRLRFQDK